MRFILLASLLLYGCATNNPTPPVRVKPVARAVVITNTVSIMPTDSPAPTMASDAMIAAMVMELRAARMEAARLSSVGTQAFTVTELEEISSAETDYDARGLPTGTFTPRTNYMATLNPTGTNAPGIRGASRDGSLILIFLKPIGIGSAVDMNIRRVP